MANVIINIDDIFVPNYFMECKPNERKYDKKKCEWLLNGCQVKPITIKGNMLVDGYCQYLLAKEFGCEKIDAIQLKKKTDLSDTYKGRETVYIYGKHLNSRCIREFVWRLKPRDFQKKDLLKVGDNVMANTKFGKAPIEITKIEVLNETPTTKRVKTILPYAVWRDGIRIIL